MGLRDVVITSVTRDDLPDGGAAVWAETVKKIRGAVPGILVEVLVPDFQGDPQAIGTVLAARPDVFGHNLETVPDLYPAVRPEADYARSLDVLRRGSRAGLIAKTGLMVGVGETADQVPAVMRDARAAGVEVFYIGQYLRPTREHLPVERYVEPAEFDRYRAQGLELGFPVVVAAPLVRSSYHSDEQSEFVAGRPGRRR
jgi:lipoic acid synthetase